MVWKKTASNHVAEILNVRVTGWKEAVRYTGQFVAAGFLFGLAGGLTIGWIKNDEWNGQEIAAKKWQAAAKKNKELRDQVCRDFPNSGICKK